MSAPRTILHADMDAFYAAVEQRDRPELRGRPVIIGGHGPRQVVSTASYEARAFGVRSAMPGRRARELCPEGVFVVPRMAHYAEISGQIHEVFEQFTDEIEPLSLDEAFLDVTGSRALFGDGRAIADQIRREVYERTQLRVSVGVASCKYVAKVASDLDKPDGLVVVPPGGERRFLADLPLSRLWGVGPATRATLERAGLASIRDVQSRSREQLTEAFGPKLGEHLFVLANGLDERPVVKDRVAKSIGHEMTFSDDLVGRAEVHAVLLQLAEMVGRRLRRAGQQAAVVRLKLRHPPFETLQRQRKVAATDDDLELLRVADELLGSAWDGARPVRLLGLTGADLRDTGGDAAPAPVQRALFEAPEERAVAADSRQRSKLLQAMDAIRDRHGERAVRHGGGRGSTNPWGPDRGQGQDRPD
ncbi:MAG: DNA polymerase IV [Planctomycetota bacterium]|nr:DNA polymerase IV [Planctomycetota bacterium]